MGLLEFGSWLICSESVLCLILLCRVDACCFVVVVILLRWLVKWLVELRIMAVGEFILFCAALFTSWIGAAGRVLEAVAEMKEEEPILEEMLENSDLLEGENGDDGYAVLVENGDNVAKVGAEDDRKWLRWWRIGRAQQERDEMWRRVWCELDRRNKEAFVDVLVYYGELLWNIEDLGDEYVRRWDRIVEDFGNIDIDEDEEKEEWWD